MNFVAQLEDYLRDLGAEARKKHPGVKEASERAILKLRSLQNAYVSAVRKATNNGGEHPDTTLFRSSDLLHPFLLATNYPNASPKLLDTSFKAMKTLMEANAICPGDGMNLVRVWKIQATVVVSYSNKESGKSGGINGKASNKSTIHSIDESISQSTSSNNSGSSWLPSFLSSSSSELPSNTTSRSFTTNAVSTKTAVSSSHGQAGSGHLNAKDLEKLALDILSCLLQLLELRDLPVSTEQWIQSVTLCCLLQQPLRQIVRQAANSTLPQVLTLLVRDKAALPLAIATWNDLLTCASGLSINPKHNRNSLQGAFSQCRLGERDAPLPPSPSLCLDLMTTLLKEAPSVFTQMGREKLGLVVQVLHNHSTNTSKTSPASPNEFLRILQFVLVVVQTQANEWPTECRELTLRLLAPIPLASEAIRKQDYFEDGYIYNTPNKLQKPSSTSSIPTIPSTSKDNTLDTLQKLPPTILWKAALCLETLKSMVQDRKLQIIWMHVDVLVNMLEAASDFCTIGASCQEHMHLLVLACRQHRSNDSLAHSAEALNAEKHLTKWQQGKHKDDTYVLGDALWVGLTLVLKMIEGLDETVLEQAFAPSLAVLQHYLKRFPASGTIVKRALEGYFSLAKLSLKLPLLRGALLTSLCKLSLPQWGTQDATCQLKDQNIAALICLINIIHRYYDDIGSEWSIVCQTFQELSVLTIASPHLSNSAYVGALSISAAYSRFASFSTCLSDESLVRFVEGLREVSLLEKTTTSNMITNPRIPDRQSQTTPDNERGTISEKLMNIGVRAIYGSNEGQEDEDVPLAERTKNTYFHDYQMEFSRRLATSKYPIRVHQVPFSFSLLADVAMTNSFRHSRCGATIFRQLCTLASESPSMKMFPMDTVAMLIMSHIRQDGGFPISFKGPGEIMYKDPRQNQYLAVETVKGSDGNNKDAVTQVDLLGPLCECIRDVKVASVAEAGVEALHSVLESSGHKLNVDAWTVVIQAVASLPDSDTRSSSEWSNSCLVGFRCLKLIVDDFVDHTDSSMEARTSLLDCCSSFGSSHHDVNTSLTAIGLLWTIADQDAGTAAIDRALSKLVILSSDTRSEVRNCSVNTLFSCIVGRGQAFTGRQWKTCICDMVFGVYDLVLSKINNDEGAKSKDSSGDKSRYRVSIHHSRDSSGKQWVATQALVLRGLCRVLRAYFSSLLDTTDDQLGPGKKEGETPWFDGAWNKILSYAFDASTQVGGRDTLDFRNAGVELLVLCNQLSCTAGIQAAITPARVGTNMEVVNGALRSVRSPDNKASEKESVRRSHSAVIDMWRENLFLDAFDVLDSFREFLDSDASAHDESGLNQYMEPTEVQVLSKFAVDLSKLYDCCKTHEFFEDKSFNGNKSFEKQLALDLSPAGEESAPVARFIRTVVIIAFKSSSGAESRFLSQAQRSCIDLLRTMASDGSPEALINLTVLSGLAFFSEQEANGKPKKGVDILSHEASNVLHEQITNSNVSDTCRVLILCRVVSLLLDEEHEKKAKKRGDSVEQSFKLLVPLMAAGLESARELQLDSNDLSDAKKGLLDNLWGNVCILLTKTLTPTTTPNGSKLLKFQHAVEMVDLVRISSKNGPIGYTSRLCAILSAAASKCLDAAKAYSAKDLEDANLQKHREESLNLFAACFRGVCCLQPKYKNLKITAEQVLTSTMKLLSGQGDRSELEPSKNVNVLCCLLICNVMQETVDVEHLAIAVFPLLCQLVAVGAEDPQLRQALGGVLAKVDVAKVLEENQARCEEAEERALKAEIKVSELSLELEKVHKEKEALERQLALL